MPHTEHTQQSELSSLEDAISHLRLDMVNQYRDLYPEVPFMQPMPPMEHSEHPGFSPLEATMVYLRMNWGNPYGDLYLELALLQALKEARLDTMEELLEKAVNANLRSGDERTSLFRAIELGFEAMATSLLQQGEKGQRLLCLASLGGNVKIMSFLLDNGAQVDEVDESGWTPLMIAAERGHDEAVALLLKHEADPNARDSNEFTALLHAAMIGYLDIVDQLLDAGADPTAEDEEQGLTAMSWAAEDGHLDIVKLLLERGVDPNLDDRVLLSALKGCDPDDFGDSDEMIKTLLKHGAEVFIDGWSDERPLVIAARQGRYRTVELFLKASYSSWSRRQEHIWDAITAATEECDEAVIASLMKHYEPNDIEKQSNWDWFEKSQLGDSFDLLKPYFEPDGRSQNGGN
ncbi:ankyrin repeat domain-containing protein [Fusarium phyllophilum]|uniref:Ankyrin repeat domain-containing protein n=1 Tax=Fusarium phyllophilum TaxID=47803 RepID=A0A8H5JTN1_9HYPO|nr:ankyrin repeat domain-containing protein [Fusarium phyllophilum]